MAESPAHPKILIKGIVASQYVAKVICALDYLRLTYSVEILPPLKLKKLLPPPHTVPVMHFGDDPKAAEVVNDSTDILKFVCEKIDLSSLDGVPAGFETFFPDEAAADLDKELGARFNVVGPLYWNWVSDAGFERSIRPKVQALIPSFVRCLVTPEKVVRSQREAISGRVKAVDPSIVDDESALKSLEAELAKIEARFLTDDQAYLLGTPHPTGPDFSLYGMMHHLVSHTGDAQLAPALPDMFARFKAPRLQAWFKRMEDRFPVAFKGKRDGYRAPPPTPANDGGGGEGKEEEAGKKGEEEDKAGSGDGNDDDDE